MVLQEGSGTYEETTILASDLHPGVWPDDAKGPQIPDPYSQRWVGGTQHYGQPRPNPCMRISRIITGVPFAPPSGTDVARPEAGD